MKNTINSIYFKPLESNQLLDYSFNYSCFNKNLIDSNDNFLLETSDLKLKYFILTADYKTLNNSNKLFLKFYFSVVKNTDSNIYFKLLNFSEESNLNLLSNFYLSLVLRVTLNNIFLTLINNKGEVLLSLSGGRVGMKGFNRRSLNSLKLMLKTLINFLKKNRFENKLLFLFVKTNWLSLKKTVINDLFEEGIELTFIIFDITRCHNGLRKKKLRNR